LRTAVQAVNKSKNFSETNSLRNIKAHSWHDLFAVWFS
jgi:hypothetical protein